MKERASQLNVMKDLADVFEKHNIMIEPFVTEEGVIAVMVTEDTDDLMWTKHGHNLSAKDIRAMIASAENKEGEQPLAISDVSNRTLLAPQFCKDCTHHNKSESHLRCKECKFIGNQQSNFEPLV